MSRLPDLQRPEAGPARQALTASRKLARQNIPLVAGKTNRYDFDPTPLGQQQPWTQPYGPEGPEVPLVFKGKKKSIDHLQEARAMMDSVTGWVSNPTTGIPAAVRAAKENPDTVKRLLAGASGLNPFTLDFGAGAPGVVHWVAEAMAGDIKSTYAAVAAADALPVGDPRRSAATGAAGVQSGLLGLEAMGLGGALPARVATGGGKVLRSGAGGVFKGATDLPMDEASRTARARKMGFDTDTTLYHGSSDDIGDFRLGHPNSHDSGWLGRGVYLTTSPDLASIYSLAKSGKTTAKQDRLDRKLLEDLGVDQSGSPAQEVGRNIMPVHTRLQNPYMATLADKQRLQEISFFEGKAAGKEAAEAWTRELQAKGHDGVMLKYRAEDVGPKNVSTEVVVFDPSNIRSRHAAFDPAKKDSTDILSAGGRGARAPGAVAAAAPSEDRKFSPANPAVRKKVMQTIAGRGAGRKPAEITIGAIRR